MTINLANHYAKAIVSTDDRVEAFLNRQILDDSQEDFGGITSFADGLIHPGQSTGALLTLIPALVNRDSRWFGSPDLVSSIRRALEYAHRVQRPDGTFDLLPTNFFSSPDAGFIMHNLARSYRILKKHQQETAGNLQEIGESLYSLIEKTGGGMVGGGFHTPNHRWVIAAALMMARNITGNDAFADEANRYIAEGIDIDENGEFSERSAGIYNAVNDNGLIILSEELEDGSYLEYVKRNLEMMFTYWEPDGSLFTWNSRRQDKGEGGADARFFPTSYYDIYLSMLLRGFDPRYAFAADEIFNRTFSSGGPGSLFRFMLDPELKSFCCEASPPSTDYSRVYKPSGLVRIRRNTRSITLLSGSSSFLFFTVPGIRCRVKLCASFFAVAQFTANEIEQRDGTYRLVYETTADYRLPLDPPPESPFWSEMDHSKRKRVNVQRLRFTVDIREVGGGIELHIESDGCDRVPVKLELVVTAGSEISGEAFSLPAKPGGSVVVGAGTVVVESAASALRIGPAFSEHRYAADMRGSEKQSQDEFSIYFTGYTPIDRTITICEAQSDAPIDVRGSAGDKSAR